MLKCTICGVTHVELIDVLYPLNREKTLYNIYCNPTLNGCGRTVYGNSESHVVARWDNGECDTDEDLGE